MLNKYITLALLLVSISYSFGQGSPEHCATDQLMENYYLTNPGLRETIRQESINAARYRHNNTGSRAAMTVPVVIHIIHDNGVGNISDEQVMSGMEILNQDFKRLNPDSSITRNTSDAPFKSQAGSMDVEFKLAKLDPNGVCTNGIIRINSPQLSNGANEACKYSANGGSDQWPQDEYFNIWIVNSIIVPGSGINANGYAYLPYGAAGNLGFGILIRNDAFGIIETAAGVDGRTLTHEMGHSLGLWHTFNVASGGSGCHSTDCTSNGDFVCDTPPQETSNFSCSQIWNSCSDIPVGDAYGIDALDQIENYMSYNSCQNMFSMDQVGIMEANIASIPFLAGLIQPSNLSATGVNDPDVLCAAEFEAQETSVCSGTIVEFTDFSFHSPTNWLWSISGIEGTDYNYVNGTSPTSQEPSVEFITGGSYDVQLTIEDGVSTEIELKPGYITVSPQALSIDLLESFEGYTSFSATDQWSTYSTSGNVFEVIDGVSRTGTKCARLINFGQSIGQSDELISSLVDLSVIDPATESVTLSFRYAYKKRNSSNNEWLKVFISNNCGETWVQRKTIQLTQVSSVSQNPTWAPATLNDWTTVHMTNVTSGYFVDNFRYKFEFESDNGNNFYLDDINIYKGAPSDELVGIDENGNVIESMSVYPNPTAGSANVRFAVVNGGAAKLVVTDLAGKELESHALFAAAGNNLLELDTEGYASGVYMVRLELSGVMTVVRLVVE
jgi:PKD repeat protein